MQRRRLKSDLELHPVTTEVHFLQRRKNNSLQTLQNILYYLLGQPVRRNTMILDEQEEPQQEETLGSTASTLLGLNRPAPKPSRQLRRRKLEEMGSQAKQFINHEDEAPVLDLAYKPRPKRQKTRTRAQESAFDSFMDLADPFEMLQSDQAPEPDFSFSLFALFAQTAFVVVNEEAHEPSLYFVTTVAIGIAAAEMANHYMQAAFSPPLERLPQTRSLHPLDFGNPLPLLFTPGLVLPNQQSFFGQNYYRRPAPEAPRAPLPEPQNEQRLNDLGFPMDLVPEKYRCEMMNTVMDNPVKLPETGQICEGRAVLEALQRKPENPYNRKPMRMEEAKPESALRGEISRYVNAATIGVENRRQELGSGPLSQGDFQAIHQRAVQAAEQTAAMPVPVNRARAQAPREEPSAPEQTPRSMRLGG